MKPVIIIGAPRSGTNILRDSLSKIKHIRTWDCDEIPYIWRYGNQKYSTDFLKPNFINHSQKAYIRRQFTKIVRDQNEELVLEKTCANSLRVNFVKHIFPEAKFIYLLRNGYDVSYSIMQKWNSRFSLIYSLKKFRYVPIGDIPYLFSQFIRNRLHLNSKKNRLKFWGPRFAKYEDISDLSIEEISAMQWDACVSNSDKSFRSMDRSKVYNLKYEDFVTNPYFFIKEISDFIGVKVTNGVEFPRINSKSVGKGRTNLNDDQINVIKPIINETMKANGYIC